MSATDLDAGGDKSADADMGSFSGDLLPGDGTLQIPNTLDASVGGLTSSVVRSEQDMPRIR